MRVVIKNKFNFPRDEGNTALAIDPNEVLQFPLLFNIDPLAIVEPRELSRAQNPDIEVVWE